MTQKEWHNELYFLPSKQIMISLRKLFDSNYIKKETNNNDILVRII